MYSFRKQIRILKEAGSCVIMLSVFLACDQRKPTAVEQVWLMEDGLVVIEVESTEAGGVSPGKWEEVTDSLDGYTGNAAYIFTSTGNMYKDPLVHDAPMTGEGYKLSYKVWVEEPGEYELKIRNYHMQEDGDNDAWISINKALYQKIWDHDPAQWNWSEAISNIKSYQPFELHEGINTIDLLGRSKGFAIDRITIYKRDTPQEIWSDIENPESPLVAPEKKDTEAPTVPEGLKTKRVTTGSARITWEKSSDNFKVYCYEIYADGQVVGELFNNEFLIDNLEQGKPKEVSVSARDFSGNKSEQSVAIAITPKEFDPEENYVIQKTYEKVSVDGMAEKLWESIAPAYFSSTEEASYFKSCWDEEFLYFFVSVDDEKPLSEAGALDGIDLYFDIDNSKSERYGFQDRTYHFTLSRPQKEGEFHVLTAKYERDEFKKGLEEAHVINESGYTYELAFPWPTLGMTPSNDKLIGLDIVIRNTNDPEKEVENYFGWKNRKDEASQSPEMLGTVALKD